MKNSWLLLLSVLICFSFFLLVGCSKSEDDKGKIDVMVQQKAVERETSVDTIYKKLKEKQKKNAAEFKNAMENSLKSSQNGTLESKIDFLVGTPTRIALRAWFAFRDNALMFGVAGLLPFEILCLIGYKVSNNDSKIRYTFFFVGLFSFLGFFVFLLLPGILLQNTLG